MPHLMFDLSNSKVQPKAKRGKATEAEPADAKTSKANPGAVRDTAPYN